MRILSLAAAFVLASLLSGCVTFPQTPEEAVTFGKSSSLVTKKEYDLKGISLNVAGDRLEKFAGKCLRQTTTLSERGDYGGTISKQGIFKPSITRQKDRVILAVQRKQTGSHTGGNPPPDGHYLALVEVSTVGQTLHVFSYRSINGYGMSFGNFLEDAQTWLNAGGEFCPELQ